MSPLCGYCIPGSSGRAPARWHLASALSLPGSLPSAELGPPTSHGSFWGRCCQRGPRVPGAAGAAFWGLWWGYQVSADLWGRWCRETGARADASAVMTGGVVSAGRSMGFPHIQPNLLIRKRPQAEGSQNLKPQPQPLSAESQSWAVSLPARQMSRAVLSPCLPGTAGVWTGWWSAGRLGSRTRAWVTCRTPGAAELGFPLVLSFPAVGQPAPCRAMPATASGFRGGRRGVGKRGWEEELGRGAGKRGWEAAPPAVLGPGSWFPHAACPAARRSSTPSPAFLISQSGKGWGPWASVPPLSAQQQGLGLVP